MYLFLERGDGREKEGEISRLPLARPLMGTWPATQACALTGNQTSDPLVHKLVLNPLSNTSQGWIFRIWYLKIQSKQVGYQKPMQKNLLLI